MAKGCLAFLACPKLEFGRVARAEPADRLFHTCRYSGATWSAKEKSNGFDRSPPALLADANSNKVTDQKDLTEAGKLLAVSC